MKKLLTGLSLIGLITSAQAEIVFNSTSVDGALISANTDTTLAAGYTPTSATNSAVLLAFTYDSSFSSLSATFGGNAMTLLASDTRTAIFGILLSDTSSGDIVLNQDQTRYVSDFIYTYGTISGIDTSDFSNVLNGGTPTGSTLTQNSGFSGTEAGDYVLTVGNVNGTGSTGVTSAGDQSVLTSFIGVGSEYTGAIAGGVTAADGTYTPTIEFTGGSYDFSAKYMSSVKFSAIPEPGSYALLGGLLALGSVMMRRRPISA